jgi:hypothetical protein
VLPTFTREKVRISSTVMMMLDLRHRRRTSHCSILNPQSGFS